MNDLLSRSASRKPSLGTSLVFCAVLLVLLVWLRLGLYLHASVGIGYSLPIVLVGWTRRRWLVWIMCTVFISMVGFKFWTNYHSSLLPLHQRIAGLSLLVGDLLVVAMIVDMVLRRELALERGRRELSRAGQELRISNESLAERQEMTETLLKLSQSLTAGLGREALTAIVETVHRMLGESVAVALWELRGAELASIGHDGFGADGPEASRAGARNGFAYLVVESQKPVAIGEAAQRPELVAVKNAKGEMFQALLGAPLKLSGDVVGALTVFNLRTRLWTEAEISLVESLAAQASVSVTATKLLERIENDHKQLQIILDTVPLGIVRTDAAMSQLICNPAAAAMLGYPLVSESDPQAWPKVKLVGPSGEIAPHEDPLSRALRGETTEAMELEVHVAGGKLVALVNAAPIRDRFGAISGAVGAFVDISAQKALRDELDSRRKQAEDESLRKSRFLAAVSHDVRTPANAIGLLAELIRGYADDPSQVAEIPEAAQELQRSSSSLVNLVSDVLDLTRLDLGRLELRLSDFDFNQWLCEGFNQLQPLVEKKKLRFECEPLPVSIRMRADRIKLSRVLNNLIDNAIKYTERGQVHVSAEQLADHRPRISVSDTGIGITPENLGAIFDEFAQLKSPDRAKGTGSGLGLSISKRLVEIMGGRLEVISEVGKGSTFSFTLPSSCVIE
jgi:signal transduction histidine kinase